MIAFDEKVVAFEELDNQLGFQKKYAKKELNDVKKINIELLTTRRMTGDGSISSLSICKEYKIIDGSPVEILIRNKNQFDSEKFKFIKKQYNL